MSSSGYAYAEGFWLHGNTPERYYFKENKSIWLWGLIVPLMTFGLFRLTNGWILVILLGYPLIIFKITKYFQSRGLKTKKALLYAVSCLLIKFLQLQGQIQFYISKLSGKKNQLIEYKYPKANLE
ncbi:MAG: hypothetical protein QNJ60_22040 [Xenococcaceae cyanobacterium MO_188.B19]|nr:hypothetical protein [Xenococcaceae cyanobacterium MO_188.B19]